MQKEKILRFILLIFSLVGLLTSLYLYSLHTSLQSSPAICDINSKFSCSNLAQSGYSSFLGFEIAAIGALGYGFLLLLSLFLVVQSFQNLLPKKVTEHHLLQVYLFCIIIAVLFTFYLIAIEIMIQIFCIGCMVSWITTLILCLTSWCLYHNHNEKIEYKFER